MRRATAPGQKRFPQFFVPGHLPPFCDELSDYKLPTLSLSHSLSLTHTHTRTHTHTSPPNTHFTSHKKQCRDKKGPLSFYHLLTETSKREAGVKSVKGVQERKIERKNITTDKPAFKEIVLLHS